MKMKKGLSYVVVLAVVAALGIKISYGFVSSNDYYIKITKEGSEKQAYEYLNPRSLSEEGIHYNYTMKAYNKNGDMIQVSFDSRRSLEVGAYYKVTVTLPDMARVNSIESIATVNLDEVPSKTRKILNSI